MHSPQTDPFSGGCTVTSDGSGLIEQTAVEVIGGKIEVGHFNEVNGTKTAGGSNVGRRS